MSEETGPSVDQNQDLAIKAADMIGDALDHGVRPPLLAIETVVKWFGLDGDRTRPGVVCLCGLLVGRDLEMLVDYTGYDRGLIAVTITRLIWNGIWTADGMFVQWPTDGTGILMGLDAMVAAGELRRVYIADGSYEYMLAGDHQEPHGVTAHRLAQSLVVTHGLDMDEALVIAYRAWLGVDMPTGLRQSMKCLRYRARRCSANLPEIEPAIVAVWRRMYAEYGKFIGSIGRG